MRSLGFGLRLVGRLLASIVPLPESIPPKTKARRSIVLPLRTLLPLLLLSGSRAASIDVRGVAATVGGSRASKLVRRDDLPEGGSINLAARDVEVERTASLRASERFARLNRERLRPSSLPREVVDGLDCGGVRLSLENRRNMLGRAGDSWVSALVAGGTELSPDPDREPVGE